jgi:L-aminopeptidase/D-esterase-like protein
MSSARPGRTNSLVDVAGLRVGHVTRDQDGWLTGTTVVLTGDGGAVGGVDVRGGGPGTRETDLLDPRNLVERVHAVVLSGGSAFGLAAADGAMAWLEAHGTGLRVGPDGPVVPIVPAAVVFDLGRGGDATHRPDATFGRAACEAATSEAVVEGCVGAGTGAVAGGLKGGVGSASEVLDDGSTVAALVVVNAIGSVFDPASGELWGARHLAPVEVDVPAPDPAALQRFLDSREAAAPPAAGQATTLAVVATDRTLTKAQCSKVAGLAHDGLARAIAPVHTMFDGDTAFALATGAGETPDPAQLHAVLVAAADCTTRAVVRAVLAAAGVTTPGGRWPAYRDLAGSHRLGRHRPAG